MKTGFKFSNLCGTVYNGGNIIFTPDGNSVISPVGNRVSIFDLTNHTSTTLPIENGKNIVRCALSPDGTYLLTSDIEGRTLLINVTRKAVLAHLNFHEKPRCIEWSPDGRYFAVGLFKRIEVWRAPATPLGAAVTFAPFQLMARIVGHHDNVTRICWSDDGSRLCSASDDGTVNLTGLEFFENNNNDGNDGDDEGGMRCKVRRIANFSANSDRVKGCFFMSDDLIYVLTRDAKITAWKWLPFEDVKKEEEEEEDDEGEEKDVNNNDDEIKIKKEVKEEDEDDDINEDLIKIRKDDEDEDDGNESDVEMKYEGEDNDKEYDDDEKDKKDIVRFQKQYIRKKRLGRWTIAAKYNIGTTIGQKVKCCVFHKESNLLVVGFAVKLIIFYIHI